MATSQGNYKKCPTCSLYNQTPLPTVSSNSRGIQRSELWQIDVFYFVELKYVHHIIDTYSGFQWATALDLEKVDSVITHLLKVYGLHVIPEQIRTYNVPACL